MSCVPTWSITSPTTSRTTGFLHAKGDIALAFPADLDTNSGALIYVLRECEKERVFSLRPQVGEILTLPPKMTKNASQTVHLSVVRANQQAPLIAEDYLRCKVKWMQRLNESGSTPIHLPILDPERPMYSLVNLYRVVMDLFADTNIRIILQNCVYVSILGIEVG